MLFLCDGHTQFAKLMGKSLITDDGEAIEGTALEEVEVLGRVTFFINRALDDDCPAMLVDFHPTSLKAKNQP